MSDFKTKPNPLQPERCPSIDPHDTLQCARRIHEDDQCVAGGIGWKKGTPRYITDRERVELLEAEVARLLSGTRCPQCSATEWNQASMLRNENARLTAVVEWLDWIEEHAEKFRSNNMFAQAILNERDRRQGRDPYVSASSEDGALDE